jgi:hypothetical protein
MGVSDAWHVERRTGRRGEEGGGRVREGGFIRRCVGLATFGVCDEVFEFVEIGNDGALGQDGLEFVLVSRIISRLSCS